MVNAARRTSQLTRTCCLVWVAVTSLWACGGSTPASGGGQTTPAVDGGVFPRGDISGTGGGDAGSSGGTDALVLPDVNGEEQVCANDGAWGCPCNNNDACTSGYCVESEMGKVCSRTCTSQCPADWVCVQAPDSADLKYVCLPQFVNLCRPCNSHKDCATAGAKDAYCVPNDKGDGFIDGSFCGTSCATDEECKSGFVCKEVKVDGVDEAIKQCVPQGGECSCLSAWSEATVSTECLRTNEYGTCKASRTCSEAGLTLCDAAVPDVEVCDGVDNDCNGETDEVDAADCVMFYVDNDKDGYGLGEGVCACEPPGSAYAAAGGDCNDLVATIKPGAPELCDNQDNNCNGQTDEAGAKGCKVFYKDKDGDKFGDPDDSACMCPSKKTAEWLEQGGDCDDGNKLVFPGTVELCNNLDDNCNAKTDEENAQGCQLFYTDADGDNFGPSGAGKCLCKANKLYATEKPGDCDDNNDKVNPVTAEICNGIDDDCSGAADDSGASASCPPVAGGAAACINGQCGVGACASGLFDVDGDKSNGCECAADSNYGKLGNVCGNAIELGEMPDGSNTVTAKGNLMPGEDGDWFHFYAKDQPDDNACDQFHVRIKFVSNPGDQFQFDVYRKSCAGADQVCAAVVEHSWSTSFYGDPPSGSDAKPQPGVFGDKEKSPVPEKAGECKCLAPKAGVVGASPGMNVCSDNSAHYYVRVVRKKGVQPLPMCIENAYILQLNNSPP